METPGINGNLFEITLDKKWFEPTEREYVIYTGRRGFNRYNNTFTEMFHMGSYYRNRFIKLHNKVKHKKLYNTFIPSFINNSKGFKIKFKF